MTGYILRLGILALLVGTSTIHGQTRGPSPWTEWGGASRNFMIEGGPPLADTWPEQGPPVLWTRPLGTGHSSIVVDDGRLYTMYRKGDGRARRGPWEAEEAVIALDAKSGATIWEHKYPSRREDFGFGAGPHSTPLVVGDRLFAIGTQQQLFAFDKRSGKVLWSRDFVRDFNSPELLIRPVVKVGYACSLVAYGDTIICSVGGPGQSVMAFRQSDGAVVWKSGDFLTSAAAPILIEFQGSPQLVFLAGGTVTALDPSNGRILWSTPHDPGNDLNCGTPIWGPDNILFVSSAYRAGSRAIQLKKVGNATVPEDLWFTNRVRFMFLSALRLGDFVYGTTGDFGPAFLTALNVKTGQPAWQHRGFGRASLLQADGKTIILDEDGDLALALLSPEGAKILAQAKIFDTVSWTAPTLVGTTLYARDREKIVALDLGKPGAAAAAAPSASPPRAASASPAPSASARAESQASYGETSPKRPAIQSREGGPARPALGGTWKLDTAASRIDPAAGLNGLIGAGAPPMLFITEPANGDLIVESPINEGHARLYRPGSKTETPVGQGGSITMTMTRARNAVMSEGTAAGAAGATTSVKERYAVSADGKTLSVDVTTSGNGETKTSELKYVRVTDVGPCESWPTPCKRFP
jgi:outer membrane protein assembly factor BamB